MSVPTTRFATNTITAQIAGITGSYDSASWVPYAKPGSPEGAAMFAAKLGTRLQALTTRTRPGWDNLPTMTPKGR